MRVVLRMMQFMLHVYELSLLLVGGGKSRWRDTKASRKQQQTTVSDQQKQIFFKWTCPDVLWYFKSKHVFLVVFVFKPNNRLTAVLHNIK